MKDRQSPRLGAAVNGSSQFKEYMQTNFQLTEHEWELTEPYIRAMNIRKGEYFVREGTICRTMAFIVEGVMRYVKFEENGDVTTCYFVSENDFVGDPESFDAQKPSDKNLTAITDCMLATISYEGWQRLSKDFARFGKINAAIQQTTFMKLLRQQELLLNKDAASKYQNFIESFPHIIQRVPLGYIASYLGIAQQSLSRLRKQI